MFGQRHRVKMWTAHFCLPREVVAKLLEFSDIKSIARFEIAFPEYANIVHCKSVTSVNIALLKNRVIINKCSVKYSTAVDCLKWLKSRRGMAPKTLKFVLSYPAEKSSSDANHWTEKIISFAKIWSLEISHFAVDLSGYSATVEGIIDLLVHPSESSHLLSLITYERQFVCAICQSTYCIFDPLLHFNDINLFDKDIKSSLAINGLKLFLDRIVRLKNPKELRIFGSKRSTMRTIFWRTFGIISLEVKKLVLHAPGGYELYDFWADTNNYESSVIPSNMQFWELPNKEFMSHSRRKYLPMPTFLNCRVSGLHIWFPNLKQCTLIDPDLSGDVDNIWILVKQCLDANHSIVINLYISKCSKTTESSLNLALQKLSTRAAADSVHSGIYPQEIAFRKSTSQSVAVIIRLTDAHYVTHERLSNFF